MHQKPPHWPGWKEETVWGVRPLGGTQMGEALMALDPRVDGLTYSESTQSPLLPPHQNLASLAHHPRQCGVRDHRCPVSPPLPGQSPRDTCLPLPLLYSRNDRFKRIKVGNTESSLEIEIRPKHRTEEAGTDAGPQGRHVETRSDSEHSRSPRQGLR